MLKPFTGRVCALRYGSHQVHSLYYSPPPNSEPNTGQMDFNFELFQVVPLVSVHGWACITCFHERIMGNYFTCNDVYQLEAGLFHRHQVTGRLLLLVLSPV